MVRAFWVVLEGGAWGTPFTVTLSDGTEAIALFSGEEEARMFRHFRGEEETIATIRRTTAGGILSILYCPWSARRVVFDPLPGALGHRLSEPLALSRTRFFRRFVGADPEPIAGSSRGPVRTRIAAAGDAVPAGFADPLAEAG